MNRLNRIHSKMKVISTIETKQRFASLQDSTEKEQEKYSNKKKKEENSKK